MSRHLDNLKRVFQKLQVRYGEDDPMVLQVKQELESRQVIESRYPDWPVADRQGLPGQTAERRWDAVSGIR
ncbi:MAG: hypothetical protein Q7T46_03400 [Polaromonas sp.]|jgi:hypothetical protein|nr:hypothetical protein [Polaromonas sp.]